MIYRFRRDDVRQEEDTIPWVRVAYAFFITITLSLALIACAWSILKAREAELRPSGHFPEATLGPRRNVASVRQDLYGDMGEGQGLFADQRRQLERYDWVDKKKGLISIPIDRAMDLVVEESRR